MIAIEVIPIHSDEELKALAELLSSINGSLGFQVQNSLLSRLREDVISKLKARNNHAIKTRITSLDYNLIKMGYSSEVVCSSNEKQCRNKSCSFYNEEWAGNCSDNLNCQPCPRSNLK